MQMPARTPAMCAMQAMTVDQLSGGRMIVGLGPGPSGPQVVEGWHGVAYEPLKRTREYITIMREIFKREKPVEFQGEYYQMPYKGPGSSGLGKPLRSILHSRTDIPIYTETISPKGVETATDVADGFIPVWTTPKGLETFVPHLEAGVRKAGGGKAFANFEIAVSLNVVVSDDLQAARDSLKPGIARSMSAGWVRAARISTPITSAGRNGPVMRVRSRTSFSAAKSRKPPQPSPTLSLTSFRSSVPRTHPRTRRGM